MNAVEILGEFQNYQIVFGPKFTNFCVQGKAKYNRSIGALIHLYQFQSFLLNNEKTYFPNNTTEAITLLFNKSAGTVLAVEACLESGQLLAASSLIRDLFEILVDIAILTEQDTEERSRLFLNYGIVQQWLHLQNHKSNIKIIYDRYSESQEYANANTYYKKLTEPDLEKQVDKNYIKVKDNYHPRNPFHWAWKIFKEKLSGRNPSIKFLSQEYNLYDDYIKVYSLNSLSVHSSPLSKAMLIQKDVITCAPNYSDNIISISAECFDLASKISMLIVQHSGSEYCEQIKEVLDRTFVEAY